jgi:hypothetical protein
MDGGRVERDAGTDGGPDAGTHPPVDAGMDGGIDPGDGGMDAGDDAGPLEPPVTELPPRLAIPCDDSTLACCAEDGFVERGLTSCGDVRIAEYDCADDGSHALVRYGTPTCTGLDDTCSAAPEHVWFGEWQRIDCPCARDESGVRCLDVAARDADASCAAPDGVRPAGSPCGASEPAGPSFCFEDARVRWDGAFCDPLGRCRPASEGVPAVGAAALHVEEDCAWPDGEVCALRAGDDGPEAICVRPPDWCDSDGPCCDPVAHRLAPSGTECGSAELGEPFCQHGRLVRNVTSRVCAGRTDTCIADERRVEVIEDCAADGGSCLTSETVPGVEVSLCVPVPDAQCAAGACCNLTTYQLMPADTPCGDDRRTVYPSCDDLYTRRGETRVDGCDGVSPTCQRAQILLETSVGPCPSGTLCLGYVAGGNGVCHDPSIRCDPADECCTDAGTVAPQGYACGDSSPYDPPLHEEGTCDADGRRLIRREYPGCTGEDSTTCSTAPEDRSVMNVTTLPCGDGEECAVAPDGVPRCIPIGSSFCTGGSCCDAETGLYSAPGTACGTSAVDEAYRCSPDGSALERRQAFPGCNGSGYCSSSPTYTSWGPWEPVLDCPGAEDCVVTSGEGPHCELVDPDCTAGSCCSGGLIQPAGTSCGIQAELEYDCVGGDVWQRRTDYVCDGASHACPFDATLVDVGEWELREDCAEACRIDTDGRARCYTPSTGGGGGDGGDGSGTACGNACYVGGICPTGSTCLDGICLPTECAGCFDSGRSCNYSPSSCSFFECVTEGGGSGSCYPSEGVLRQENVRVGDVLLSAIEISYRLSVFFGEPTENMSWRYWSSPSGQDIPPSSRIYVAVRDASGRTWYADGSPPLPASEGQWAFNVTASPSWNEWLCGGPTAPTTCLSESEAQALYRDGLCVTGFMVVAP